MTLWVRIAIGIATTLIAYLGFHPAGRRQLGTAAGVVMGYGLMGLMAAGPTIAVAFAKGLIHTFDTDQDTWADVVSVFVSEMTGRETSAADIRAKIGKGGLIGAAPALGKPLIDAVLKAVAPPKAITAVDGGINLESLLGLTFAFGLQGWWVTAAGDFVSLGRLGASADLPDAMEKGLGLSRIGRLAWRLPITKGIIEPLTIYYNNIYQLKLLSITEAVELWHRGMLKDDEYFQAARDIGYSPTRASQLLGLGQKEWTLDQLRDLWRYFQLDKDTAITVLGRQGYLPDQTETAFDLAAANIHIRLLEELASNARKLWKRGTITDADLQQFLTEAGYRADEITLVQQVDKLDQAHEKTLARAEVLRAFREGIMTEAEATARLTKEGFQPADVDVLLRLEQRGLTVAQLFEEVARGLVSVEDATAQLVARGYSQRDATALLSLRARRLTEGQVLDALKRGLINRQQAEADLQAQGIDQSTAEVLLGFVARELGPQDIQAAVLRGFITPQDAQNRLIALGFSLPDAELIVQLRRRLLSPGEIADAFDRKLLGAPVALGDLEQLGFDRLEALTVLRVFWLKEERKEARIQHRHPATVPPF